MNLYSHWESKTYQTHKRHWFSTKKEQQERQKKAVAEGYWVGAVHKWLIDSTAIDLARFLNDLEVNKIADVEALIDEQSQREADDA